MWMTDAKFKEFAEEWDKLRTDIKRRLDKLGKDVRFTCDAVSLYVAQQEEEKRRKK